MLFDELAMDLVNKGLNWKKIQWVSYPYKKIDI